MVNVGRVTTGDGGGRVARVGTRVGGVGAGHGAEVCHDFGVVAGDGAPDAVGEGQDHEDEGDDEAGGGDGGATIVITQGGEPAPGVPNSCSMGKTAWAVWAPRGLDTTAVAVASPPDSVMVTAPRGGS